ncbi:MAG: hypothetical protein KGS45_08540 [Planctomycetes bacterium]|nr:hypothetical protein [Planctomycetota bacterium]
MPRSNFSTLLTSILIAASSAHAQIDLVADLRTGAPNTQNTANPSGPFGILPTSAGPLALFPAPDPNYGRVLWKSDGTTTGTTLVRDYGIDNLTTQSPRDFVLYQNRLFFTSNLFNSSDLWICSTNGTSCGTRVHFRILSDGGTGGLRPAKLTVMGDWLYYVGWSPNGNAQGIELHRTDGTAANTTIVADLTPGANGTSITTVVTNGSRLFLVATVPNTIGTELYISDGSTITPVDIATGAASSNPASLTILGSTCYFTASTLASGNELWKSDGTVNGTLLAADIIPGASSSLPTNLSTHDGNLYFAAMGRDANNVNIGNELFVYDGTAATLVADIFPGSNSSSPTRVITHGPDAYFSAIDSTFSSRLYRTRGTAGTTVSIAPSLRLNLSGGGGATIDMASTANGVVFRAQPNNQTPFSIWVTDGTVGNATNISSVYPNGSTTSGTSAYMTPLGDGRVIFSGATSTMNFEPWITDGTVNGTFELRDIWTTAQGSSPQTFVPWNDQFAFLATALGTYRELYATQGTPSSTIPLLAIPPGNDERNISTFTPWSGGGALIAASNTSTPFQVLNIPSPGAAPEILADNFIATNLIPINNSLLATAQNGVYTDLYILSAGNPPTFLDPINRPHSVGSNTSVEMNGWLYFTGQNESDNNLYWLWRTDGTTTQPIVRLAVGSDTVSSISRMTRAGNRLYMRITTSFTGTELWTSDGTAQGTHIVTDLNPGTASGIVANDFLSVGVLGERLVFRAVHPTQGIELFITDGTPNGTYSLGDINPGTANGSSWASGTNLQVVGTKIFVAGTSPEFGSELWMSDGSPNSLTRITDLFPGPESSNPSRFTTDGEKLFFVAEGCTTGKELYTADTNGNITLLAETLPGPEHTYIQQTFWFGGSLYFTHNHPTFGRELFRIRTAPCAADFNADDILDLFDYLDFVAAFAASEPAADFNQDSVIDFFDYLDFVASFAAGC